MTYIQQCDVGCNLWTNQSLEKEYSPDWEYRYGTLNAIEDCFYIQLFSGMYLTGCFLFVLIGCNAGRCSKTS